MTIIKTLLVHIALGAALLGPPGRSALAETAGCKEPATGTKDVPVFSPPLSNVVKGTGRLQFYSAPSLRCPMAGVFVIPRDELIAYAQTDDGWSSVMYQIPEQAIMSWVGSDRND